MYSAIVPRKLSIPLYLLVWYSFAMKLSDLLSVRGFINQCSTDAITEVLDGEPRTVYHGIDPTADSAHAGNFVIWMLLRHLIDHGHKVVFLVGGGTGMIGDPKPDVERPLSDPTEVAARVEKLRIQAQRLLGDKNVEFVNNVDWLGTEKLITFLRDVGKHFTVNELIKKDAIAKRLTSEQGISYTEFAYPLLQAYDYLTLFREKKCTLQVGGSDQWGNIIAGVELVRRAERASVYALTVPLIVDKATGKKFGKSEGNAVWLDAEKTSPYLFYQFWLNASDESVIDYLRLFTMLSLEEIDVIAKDHEVNPGARRAQRILAREITAFVHGKTTAHAVERAAQALFGEVSFTELAETELAVIKENAPCITVADGTTLMNVLVTAGLATSNREARTFITGGAIQINGEKVDTTEMVLTKTLQGTYVLIRRGKKQLVVVEIQ